MHTSNHHNVHFKYLILYINHTSIKLKLKKAKTNIFLPSHGKLQDVECGNWAVFLQLELNSSYPVWKGQAISPRTDTSSTLFCYIACPALMGMFFEMLLGTKRTGSCVRGRKKNHSYLWAPTKQKSKYKLVAPTSPPPKKNPMNKNWL